MKNNQKINVGSFIFTREKTDILGSLTHVGRGCSTLYYENYKKDKTPNSYEANM